MPTKLESPTKVESIGTKPKIIHEYIGLVNSKTNDLSIAHMQSPCGWSEPGQRPDFNEYTVVLEGRLKVETEKDTIYVNKGQAIIAYAGEWVRYSTPYENGAKYLAVCVPAFTLETVHRDKEQYI